MPDLVGRNERLIGRLGLDDDVIVRGSEAASVGLCRRHVTDDEHDDFRTEANDPPEAVGELAGRRANSKYEPASHQSPKKPPASHPTVSPASGGDTPVWQIPVKIRLMLQVPIVEIESSASTCRWMSASLTIGGAIHGTGTITPKYIFLRRRIPEQRPHEVDKPHEAPV